MIAVKLGCDRLSNVATATNFCFFCFQSTHFFVTDQCVINFVHSATTRSTIVDVGLIHEIDRRRFLLATPIRLKTDNAPWERTFPAGHFPLWHCPDTCVRQDTTRSASAALDAGNQLPHKLTTRGKVLSGEYRFPRKRNSRPSSTNHCPQAVLLLIYYRKTI